MNELLQLNVVLRIKTGPLNPEDLTSSDWSAGGEKRSEAELLFGI